jgi:hypothetical protein
MQTIEEYLQGRGFDLEEPVEIGVEQLRVEKERGMLNSIDEALLGEVMEAYEKEKNIKFTVVGLSELLLGSESNND